MKSPAAYFRGAFRVVILQIVLGLFLLYRVNLFCRVCRRAVGEREWRKHLSHKVNNAV